MADNNEIGAEARDTLQQMMLLPQRNKIAQKLSLKKKRETESTVLLKAQGIKFGTKCCRCEVNCVVKHDENMTFWAKMEGIEPEYCMDQREEEVSKLMKQNHLSREDAGAAVDSEVQYYTDTAEMTTEEALMTITGLKPCPKQGHIEKSKIKHKRRAK